MSVVTCQDESENEPEKLKRSNDELFLRPHFFPKDLAAERLQVSDRQYANYKNNKSKIPFKYKQLLRDMGEGLLLPTDYPPDEESIGHSAFVAIKAIQRGAIEEAEALSTKGMVGSTTTWVPVKNKTPLNMFFNRLANGVAWSQHDEWKNNKDGLPALLQLHTEVQEYAASNGIGITKNADGTETVNNPHWTAWRYLMVATTSYAAAYYVARIGLGCFVDLTMQKLHPFQSMIAEIERSDKKLAAQKLLKLFTEDFHTKEKTYDREPIMSLRLTWNIIQLAALADDKPAFTKFLRATNARFEGEESEIIAMLKTDIDCARMLNKPD